MATAATRRRWVAGVAAAGLVTAVVGGGALLLRGDEPASDDTRGIVATDEATTTTVASTESTAPSAGDGEIAWQQADLPVGQFEIVAADGRFVAIGQAPGDTPVWTSADGLAWERLPVEAPLPPDAWFHDFTWTGERYVGIGELWTGPGEQSATHVATSQDGTSWELTELEFPPPRFDDPLIREHRQVESLAAGPGAAVAIGMVFVDLEIDSLLVEHLPEPGMEGLGIGYGFGGPDGGDVEVTDSEGNVIFESTLEELGVGPETLAVVEGGAPEAPILWWTADYASWERLDDPFGANAYVHNVVVVGDGFMAFGGGEDGPLVWTSTDGRAWTAGASPFGPYVDVRSVATTPWGFVAAGDGRDGPAMWLSTDGATWTEATDAAQLDARDGLQYSIHDLAAGPAGILAVGEAHDPGPPFDIPPVRVEHDGKAVTWEQDEMEFSLTVTDLATGEVLMEVVQGYEDREPPPEFAQIDDENFVIVDPDTGDVVVSVPQELVAEAHDAAFEEVYRSEFEPGFPDVVLWYSPDGTAWSRWRVADLFGVDAWPIGVAVGHDQLLVAVQPIDEEPDDPESYEPLPPMVFVGTPAG